MKQPGFSCSQEDLHEHLLVFHSPLFFKLLGETEAKELCIMTLNFLKLDNLKIYHISTLRRLLLLSAESQGCRMQLNLMLNVKINHCAGIKQKVIKYFEICLNYSKVPKLKCRSQICYKPPSSFWEVEKQEESKAGLSYMRPCQKQTKLTRPNSFYA